MEQANRKVVYSHELFTGRKFIGSFEDLKAYVQITVHTTAFRIREYKDWPNSAYGEGYGDWPHFVA